MRKLYPSCSNGNEERVTHSSSAQRVCFNEDNSHCEGNKRQKRAVAEKQNNNKDVAQVGKRAVSTTSRFGAIWSESC